MFPEDRSQQVYSNTHSHMFSQRFLLYATGKQPQMKPYTTNLKPNTHSSSIVHSSNESGWNVTWGGIRSHRLSHNTVHACLQMDAELSIPAKTHCLSLDLWPLTYDLCTSHFMLASWALFALLVQGATGIPFPSLTLRFSDCISGRRVISKWWRESKVKDSCFSLPKKTKQRKGLLSLSLTHSPNHTHKHTHIHF